MERGPIAPSLLQSESFFQMILASFGRPHRARIELRRVMIDPQYGKQYVAVYINVI